jgi:hypothetical protein
MEAAAARGSRGNSRKMKRTLPGVDVFLLHLGVGGLVKMAAVRAGHRGIFDDGDRSIRLALDLVAKRTGHEEIGHRYFPARASLSRGRVGRVPKVISGTAGGDDRDDRGGADEQITAGDAGAGFGFVGHGL